MWNTAVTTALEQFMLAQPEGGGTGAEQKNIFSGMFPLMIAFFAIMYFLMIRPNQKRERERREMLAALSKGDRVVTNGGIFGTIVGVHEKSIVLRVSDEPLVKLEFALAAVSRVEKPEKSTEKEKEASKKK